VLWLLNWIESRLRRECRATLCIELDGVSPSESEIRCTLEIAGLGIARTQITLSAAGKHREVMFDLLEYRLPNATENPPIAEAIAAQEGLVRLEWKRL
jgi:hypothetical protein